MPVLVVVVVMVVNSRHSSSSSRAGVIEHIGVEVQKQCLMLVSSTLLLRS